MNNIKKSIRPKLDLQKASTKTEQFQNEVLRPILKLQHDILLQLCVQFSTKQKTDIKQLSKEKFVDFVKISVEKNTVFRNQIIGVVIGQFTVKEFTLYSNNTSEFNKRIVTMVCKRLVDSFEEIKVL